MSFIYNFDMSKVISHFKLMPKETQISAEVNVVDVIYQSFVVSGDQDYLAARFMAINGLSRAFFWAAAQAVEKYFKAFLLMNGLSVQTYKGHPIIKLFEASQSVELSISRLDISPHVCIPINSSVNKHIRRFTVVELLKDFEKYGSADNRYNIFGIDFNTGHLLALDALIFQLRELIGVDPIEKSFSNLGSDVLNTFQKYNPWFYPGVPMTEVPNPQFPISNYINATKYEILEKNKKNPAYRLALVWLRKHMRLPESKFPD